jgi:hypothetical protein
VHVLTKHVEALRRLLGMPVVVYAVTPGPFKPIEEADVEIVHTCLMNTLGDDRRVALVLQTAGGYVNAARRLAVLLRDHVDTLHIVVPHKAISAGTLLCLAADELVLGRLAELSPLDPNVSSAHPQAGMPPSISSADIHGYVEMAEVWFGLDRERHGLELFKLLNQKIFPTSLSSFYRSERQMVDYCREFLCHSMAKATPAEREVVAEKLVRGYGSHDYVITRPEVLDLGLAVRLPPPDEERAAFDLVRACRTVEGEGMRPRVHNCVVASDVFLAVHETQDYTEHVGSSGNAAIAPHFNEEELLLTWRVRT